MRQHAQPRRGIASAEVPSQAIAVLEEELAEMEKLDLAALRLRWRNRFGRRAPRHLSRSLLQRIFAYRIQEQAFGGLSAASERLLHRMAKGDASAISSPASSLKPGTVLTREWQGRMEQVMVLEDGFAWRGQRFASLSATAFGITGTKWNGRRFFGLQERGRRSRHTGGEDAPPSCMEPAS
jgi:hypothetical protein